MVTNFICFFGAPLLIYARVIFRDHLLNLACLLGIGVATMSCLIETTFALVFETSRDENSQNFLGVILLTSALIDTVFLKFRTVLAFCKKNPCTNKRVLLVVVAFATGVGGTRAVFRDTPILLTVSENKAVFVSRSALTLLNLRIVNSFFDFVKVLLVCVTFYETKVQKKLENVFYLLAVLWFGEQVEFKSGIDAVIYYFINGVLFLRILLEAKDMFDRSFENEKQLRGSVDEHLGMFLAWGINVNPPNMGPDLVDPAAEDENSETSFDV